jgi:hypothetical protein
MLQQVQIQQAQQAQASPMIGQKNRKLSLPQTIVESISAGDKKNDKKQRSGSESLGRDPGSNTIGSSSADKGKEPRRSLKNFFRTKSSPRGSPSKEVLLGSAGAPLVTPEKIENAAARDTNSRDTNARDTTSATAAMTTTSPSEVGNSSPGSIYRPPRGQHRRVSDSLYGGSGSGQSEDTAPSPAQGRAKSKTLDSSREHSREHSRDGGNLRSNLKKMNSVTGSTVSLGFLLNGYEEMDMPTLERTFSVRSADEIERPRGDPLYNLMDSYAVMLCAALLKAGTFPSLCTIGTLGSAMLSDKARKILVHLLGVISRLFPDRMCAQLLSDPSLIEFASTFASLKLSDRALKASQLLLSLSTAFSLSRGRGGYTANSIMNNLSSNRQQQSDAANKQGGGLLDSVILDNNFAAQTRVGGMDFSGAVNPARSPSPIPTSSSSSSSAGNDFLASRIRQHRVTRVISDVLDEVAHTAYARVSRIIGTAAALKDNNPDAFNRDSNRQRDSMMGGKTDSGMGGRSSFASFMFGDKSEHSKSSQSLASLAGHGNVDRNSISSMLLAAPLKNADRGGQTRDDLMYEIKIVVTPLMDRLEFARQMEASKVVGKEGKEPFKWDWSMLSEMLEYCVRYPERLQEATKTKWVKRLCGFFRCSTDDKGYFSNLDWYPSNLHYLECACHLYGVLVEQEGGAVFSNTPFIGMDRRGMLFAEIASEIEYLVTLASRLGSRPVATLAIPHSAGHVVTNNVSPTLSRSVFRLYGCTQLMAR